MTLIPYILIAIPACLLAIAVWTYFDYRKYKKKNSLILFIIPFLSDAVACAIHRSQSLQHCIYITQESTGNIGTGQRQYDFSIHTE